MSAHPPCTGCDDPTCRSHWRLDAPQVTAALDRLRLGAEVKELRARVTELESKLAACAASCESEAGKAREAALEECAALVEGLKYRGAGTPALNAAAIRRLKRGGR